MVKNVSLFESHRIADMRSAPIAASYLTLTLAHSSFLAILLFLCRRKDTFFTIFYFFIPISLLLSAIVPILQTTNLCVNNSEQQNREHSLNLYKDYCAKQHQSYIIYRKNITRQTKPTNSNLFKHPPRIKCIWKSTITNSSSRKRSRNCLKLSRTPTVSRSRASAATL